MESGNSKPKVLFLSGQDKHRGKYESLSYCQRDLCFVLKGAGWECFHADIYRIGDIEDVYQKIKGPLLVVYTGHGDGQKGSPYPLIHPFDKAFDLLEVKRRYPTSYIFDCCNVMAQDASALGTRVGNDEAVVRFFTDCLKPDQKYIISMRPGTYGYTYDTRTFLSYAICKVLLNLKCKDVTEFSQWLGTFCRAFYKEKRVMPNTRWRYVTTLNGKNPACRKEEKITGWADPIPHLSPKDHDAFSSGVTSLSAKQLPLDGAVESLLEHLGVEDSLPCPPGDFPCDSGDEIADIE